MGVTVVPLHASMKALPRRKGNKAPGDPTTTANAGLNESPSKKEGKSVGTFPGGSAVLSPQ